MRTIIVRVIASISLASTPAFADSATVVPPVYPDNATGAKSFDWQKEWGTIHMNSFADGLNDPGQPSSGTGQVSCDNTAGLPTYDPNDAGKLYSLCKTFTPTSTPSDKHIWGDATKGQGIPAATAYSQIPNGIKYDIKRSFLGCMAQVVPNWSFTNVWDSDNPDYGPCGLQPELKPYRLETMNQEKGTKFIHDYTGDDITDTNTPQGVPKWSLAQRQLAMQTRGPGRSTLIYQPIYDPRSNDDRAWLTDHAVGCQQQIINNCGYNENGDIIRDIHACVGSPASGLKQDGEGFRHPVSHVFSPQEVTDLQTTAKLLDPTANLISLPTVYYSYQSKDKDGKVRTALSAIDPVANKDKFPDMVADGKVDKIDTSDLSNTADKYLSNLKSYRFEVSEGDPTKFVVVDPSDFFDLKLYIDGGKYASNYHNFMKNKDGSPQLDAVTKEKLVATWNTCPVLGATSGYSGICDPTSNEAGCNLPIYGENAPTEFTDANGNKSSYTNYTLQWSGYVKKWAVLTRDQYLKNICGRNQPCGPMNTDLKDREDYYIVSSEEGLNDNPIIQITRSPDYCEPMEKISNPRELAKNKVNLQTAPTDMPCIQYVQYQPWWDDKDVKHYSFVDLYNPVEASFDTIPPEADVVQLYEVDENGHPNYKKPVSGTGDNKYFTANGVATAKTGSVRLLDAEDPNNKGHAFIDPTGAQAVIATYHDLQKDPTGQSVYQAVSRNLASVQATGRDEFGNPLMTTGEYQVFRDSKGNECVPHPTSSEPGAIDPNCLGDVTKGVALPLHPGTATAVRFPHEVAISSVDQNGKTIVKQSTCVVIRYKPNDPTTTQRVFVPTNSYPEFQSFVTAAQKGIAVPGAVQAGELNFFDCSSGYQAKAETAAQLAAARTLTNNMTDKAVWIDDSGKQQSYSFKTWTGGIQCKDLVQKPACNQARIISAERRCQLENGSEGRCGDCANAADPDDVKATGFDFAENKIYPGKPGHVEVLVNPMANQNKCYFSAACVGMDDETCPPAGAPGGHVFCLAPETKITMADGTEKPIKKVKAGDEVVAFNAKRTRDGTLDKAKVAATAITKDQTIIQINNLKITPLHKIILANGRAVAAQEIKVGDVMLKGSGQLEKVTKVKKNLKKITVYNLVLEKESDGYIAGGVRVMSYPLMKEMEITSGHAPLQANNGRHRRYNYGSGGRSLSSLKQAR